MDQKIDCLLVGCIALAFALALQEGSERQILPEHVETISLVAVAPPVLTSLIEK